MVERNQKLVAVRINLRNDILSFGKRYKHVKQFRYIKNQIARRRTRPDGIAFYFPKLQQLINQTLNSYYVLCYQFRIIHGRMIRSQGLRQSLQRIHNQSKRSFQFVRNIGKKVYTQIYQIADTFLFQLFHLQVMPEILFIGQVHKHQVDNPGNNTPINYICPCRKPGRRINSKAERGYPSIARLITGHHFNLEPIRTRREIGITDAIFSQR